MRSNDGVARGRQPCLRMRGVADDHARTQMATTKVVGDAHGTRAVDFDSGQIVCAKLGQMRCLATGRSAGVEHSHAGSDAEPGRRQLRTGILYRHVAVGEARDLGHRPRLMHPDRLRADLRGSDRALRKPCDIVVSRWFAVN